jgi:hypothetical protein
MLFSGGGDAVSFQAALEARRRLRDLTEGWSRGTRRICWLTPMWSSSGEAMVESLTVRTGER